MPAKEIIFIMVSIKQILLEAKIEISEKNYTDLELVLLHLEESQMPTVIKDYKT